ncbi:hypothetical protein OF83DRAFT_535302 [Amylostereum chailletii]|nr:hypothetical protein OF83DRAFT_535302 [Amylostereum chailletii]
MPDVNRPVHDGSRCLHTSPSPIMPSARSRSRSRSRNSRDRSPSPARKLPGGAEPIADSDYFRKSAEFRVWLKDEKRKYFDELSGEKARKYFHRFVKAWNRGKLSSTSPPTLLPANPKPSPYRSESLYAGVDPSAQSITAHKWSFASHSKADDKVLQAARAEVGAATNASRAGGSSRVLGPTLPSSTDLVLAKEAGADERAAERDYQRKRDRRETREREEDMVGPRAVGRERTLEKKQERRAGDRAFRERGDDGVMEMDEGTLMGGGNSFQQALAQREAAQKRFEQRRGSKKDERTSAMQERASALREKEKATMDMFAQMAKAKFG